MSEENKKPPLRLGVGGPVGAGKTSLVKSLCLEMRQKFNLAVITNDIYTREDAEFLLKHQALSPTASWGLRREAALIRR